MAFESDDAHKTHNIENKLNEVEQLLGTSPPILKIFDVIENVASSSAPVFIRGETGTGKELCARLIHNISDRANVPFISVNCSALPEGLFESELFGHVKGAYSGADHDRYGAIHQAQNGILFLDEITEIPMHLQAKLLHFTQDYTYRKVGSDQELKSKARLICATNKNPHDLVKERTFRQDLYYRLNVVPIEMPPLRLRGEDILDIAFYYLIKYSSMMNKEFQLLDAEVENQLLHYKWPGNVRELKNVIYRIVTLYDGRSVGLDMLPPRILRKNKRCDEKSGCSKTPDIILPLSQVEKRTIKEAIKICGGNIIKAASMLEISPSTIYRKLDAWKEQPSE